METTGVEMSGATKTLGTGQIRNVPREREHEGMDHWGRLRLDDGAHPTSGFHQ